MCISDTWQRLYCIGVREIWKFHTQKISMGKLYCNSISRSTQYQFQAIDRNVNSKTINHLEGNIREYLNDLVAGKV